jgi:hypothetical protein
MTAFLSGSALSSLGEESISGFHLIGATLPDVPGTGGAF